MIQRILKYFGADGMLHIVCSTVLCSLLSAFMHVWAAALVTLGAGALKEVLWDYVLKKGTCEMSDFVADMTGTALGAACSALIIFI